MKSFIIIILLSISANTLLSTPFQDTLRIYQFDLLEDIGADSWRKTEKAFQEAHEWEAGLMLIHLNTYGGMLNAADSIRSAILNSHIPVWVLIDNKAISAGALISIAADKIFMKPGGSIGAATVVSQTGEPLHDKYQSFMRSLMRATAEAHGVDTIIVGNDTTTVWRRDPAIAEAMVDPSVDSTGKVKSFTTNEAIENHFCDGEARSINEIIEQHIYQPYVIKKQELRAVDYVIDFFINPVVQGLLIMLIIGGIYFELQTPGVGFPIVAAITAAVLYFLPLYIEGIAAYWEVILFVLGVVLLIVEIFMTPGFGVIGIVGAVMMIVGLSMAMIDTLEFEYSPVFWGLLGRSFFMVTTVSAISLFMSIWLGGKILKSSRFSQLSLNTVQDIEQGYIGIDSSIIALKGKFGVATTDLRPSGTVEIDGRFYDAKACDGFIQVGTKISVVRVEMAQIYVKQQF